MPKSIPCSVEFLDVGYSLKKIQILGGSFNPAAPPDKVPITDYLLSQNFRMDFPGQLRSRFGFVQKFSIPMPSSGSAISVGLASGVEGDWYVADSVGDLFYDFNPTAIATRLSANRTGFVFLNDFMWVMNSAVQGRHNATYGWQPWVVLAPITACVAAAGPADATGPNGTYQFWVTYQLSDLSQESDPSPASNAVALVNQDVLLTDLPICPQTPPPGLTWYRNIYATGGTLGQAYLIGTVMDNTSTSATTAGTGAGGAGLGVGLAQWNDISATDNGQVMPTTNDPPPGNGTPVINGAGAYGMTGPYFSRLIAWNTLAHPNRLYWTDPDLPQYWPGSLATSATGNWVDVGSDGEQIIWCTMHTGVLVIYKERSIWMLVGDPDSGYLQICTDEIGLCSPFAVTPAGAVDYFVGPNGLKQFNLSVVIDITGELRPLFSNQLTNAGSLTTPGSILPGPNYLTNTLDAYAVALGYGMGKLYVGYAEQGGPASGCLLIHAEGKWSYYRTAMGVNPFQAFVFDGVMVAGLTGSTIANAALAYNLDDFRGCFNQDPSATPIECVYQSHYEDCGMPDNQKVWLEAVLDIQLAGDVADIYVGLDNGTTGLTYVASIGTAVMGGTASNRFSISLALALNGTTGAIELKDPASSTQKPCLARNLSVAIYVEDNYGVVIENVYLYYYEEARLAMAASTIPMDLGIGKDKQCKELELDIDASGGPVDVQVLSDLPGNALAVRATPQVPSGGRAIKRFPFPDQEGYLWQVSLAAAGGPFRLYSARLLMRVFGVYVEAYESAAGFVYDTKQESFESLVTKVPRLYAIALAASPIKRVREISLQIETYGSNVTCALLSDLPGETMAVVSSTVVNTGDSGRRYWRIPLPTPLGDATGWIEGRMFQMQFSGTGTFKLYEAAIELLAMGIYIEAYEAAGGAVYDSRETDFTSQKPKEARELELDIETTGDVTATLYCDLPGYVMTQAYQSTEVSTTGRQQIKLPLTVGDIPFLYPIGRAFRLVISGESAFRLYGAKLRLREFGCYLTSDEASGGGVWDSTPMDMESERVKTYKRVELDIQTDGTSPVTVAILTSQAGGVMTEIYSSTINTMGLRTPYVYNIPPGIRGRLIEIIVSGNGARLWNGRVWWKPLNEPEAKWQWTPLPIPPTAPQWADAPFPVGPTPPTTLASDPAQWTWGRFGEVDETPSNFTWIPVDFSVQ